MDPESMPVFVEEGRPWVCGRARRRPGGRSALGFFLGGGYIRPAVFASLTSASEIDSGSSVEEQWEFQLTAIIRSWGTQTFS